jgi:hypothetical protein
MAEPKDPYSANTIDQSQSDSQEGVGVLRLRSRIRIRESARSAQDDKGNQI